MRRIATALAVCAAPVVFTGCGQHRYTRPSYVTAGNQVTLQPPTRIEGAIDPELRLAEDERPILGDVEEPPAPSRVPDSVMLRGVVEPGYRDSLSPDY
ncbi:MAG: hypothetical protein KatS3mg108_3470 [Isosphaeraceae bacterium]|jgi:hypothetical protein|nr:MAG: hypothetical protein KatS3mg108_3470 [Isosphaeraceae bacterium]